MGETVSLNHKKSTYLYLVILCLIGGILLFHAQYSFCQSDESFYIAQMKRIWQGDRMILDEWLTNQLYTPILMAFYAVFRLLGNSDEGIILYFRMVMVLLSILSSIMLFLEIKRKNGVFVSFCLAALLMIFSRANIGGLSYYNANLHFSAMFFVMACRCHRSVGRKAIIPSILCGCLMALDALCQPFCSVILIGYIIYLLFQRSERRKALIMMVTVLVLAAAYVAVFLTKADLATYMESLKHVLNNPERLRSPAYSLRKIASDHYRTFPISGCLAALGLSVWFYMTRRRGEELSYTQVICQVVLLVIMLIKPLVYISTLPCYTIFAAVTVGSFPLVVFYIGRKEKRLETGLYVLGLGVAAAWAMASDTGIDAMLVGYCLSGIASSLLVESVIRDMIGQNPKYNWLSIGFTCVCVFMLMVNFSQRIFGIYRDAPIDRLNTRIEQGPAKGLITTQKSAEEYNSIYETIREQYQKDPDATVLHLRILPWAYLSCDWRCRAISPWRTEISSRRLMEYYDLHGGDLPDYIFVYAPEVGAYESVYLNCHKETKEPNLMEMEGPLYEELNNGKYSIVQKPYVTIYAKNKGDD